MPDVQMVPLFPSPANVEYKGADHIYDDAGNMFAAVSAFQKTDNNITWLDVVKIAPNGVVLGSWRVFIPANTKTVGNPELSNKGTTLTVSHAVYGRDTARVSYVAFAEIAGVFVVNATQPPPPTTGDLVITSPATMAGTWRRVTSGFDRALGEMEADDGDEDRRND
jgi:hypothetical protein